VKMLKTRRKREEILKRTWSFTSYFVEEYFIAFRIILVYKNKYTISSFELGKTFL